MNFPFKWVLAQASRIHSAEAVGGMSAFHSFMILFTSWICNRSSGIQPMVSPMFFPPISLASAARSSGEAASAEPDGGSRTSGTLHASAVLSRCPFL